MLDVDRVDLKSLAEALEDHSGMNVWCLDPATGAVEPFLEDAVNDEPAPPDDWILIHALPSSIAYGDMEDFAARVRDPRARELLQRALAGRGAFRRFKDTLFEFPKLRAAWFAFHDARMQRAAIHWLADEGLIDDTSADARFPDPGLPELGKAFDAEAIARAVARDLRELYGNRLKEVILYGSWARGDAREESDIDLLVVLDRVDSVYAEIERMNDIAWRHSLDNYTVVSTAPASVEEVAARSSGFLRNALRDGRRIA